jgi:hypothetical protein
MDQPRRHQALNKVTITVAKQRNSNIHGLFLHKNEHVFVTYSSGIQPGVREDILGVLKIKKKKKKYVIS